jgi:hypothetical protein
MPPSYKIYMHVEPFFPKREKKYHVMIIILLKGKYHVMMMMMMRYSAYQGII